MSFIKPHRRLFLKSGAAALTLPLLPSIAQASTKTATITGHHTDGKGPKRLISIFFPNGVSLPPKKHADFKDWSWFPLGGTGSDYTLTKSLAPLEPFRKDMSIVGGLSHPHLRSGLVTHATADFYLNGIDQTHGYKTALSADQIYANTQLENTRFGSMVLSSTGGVGTPGRSNTLSYAPSGQPIPTLYRPTQIFDRLFGVDNRGLELQRRGLRVDASLLDTTLSQIKTIQSNMVGEEKNKLDEYLTAVRQLEEQTVRADRWLDVAKPEVDPAKFDLESEPIPEHAERYMRTLFDLMHMAFLTDSTRVATYMIDPEKNNGNASQFPTAIGLDSHHGLSHGTGKKNGYINWGKYDQWLSTQFAYLLKILRETDDPFNPGSLLDNTIVLYGSGTSTVHTGKNYPTIVAGGKNMGFKHGAYHKFGENKIDDPFNNLLLTVIQQLGVETDSFGDSTSNISSLLG